MTISRRALITSTMTAGGLWLVGSRARAQDAEAEAFQKDLTHDPDQPVIGNADGDVTLVEFFDYQCPFCRQGHPAILDLVRTDGGIRLVMKDWPIFGATSAHAVRLGLGAASLGKYETAHEALMALEGKRIAAEVMSEAVRAAGVDPDAALSAFAQDESRWSGLIARNEDQAAAIGLQGTPAYLVGWNLMAGAYDVEIIRQVIARERG